MVTGALVMLFGIFMLFYAIPAHVPLGFGSKFGMSPRSLPYGVSVMFVICGLKVLYDGWHQKRIHDQALAAKGVLTEKTVSFYALSFVIGLMGFVGTALMDLVGYPIINILMMMALYYFSGGKKLWAALALGVLFTVCSVLFFSTYLKLSMPFGLWM